MSTNLRALAQDRKAKKPTKAELEAARLEVKRIELDGPEEGHWIAYRKRMTGRQTIAMLRAGEDFAGALESLGERIVEHNFGGAILDQDLAVLTRILTRMSKEAREDALDPTSGAS